ncbi:MAG: nitroreductase family protein [Spirochaetia bacterium]|nr:nitroreductase family protein [Spirochaetia bacterium]
MMDVKDAIESRRGYRSFVPVEITDDMLKELGRAAQITASCFNNQPWRYVFVRGKEQLDRVKEALNRGNVWAKDASMIIAVFGKKEKDCVIAEREYYLFDIGMATSAMILRATEMGLLAHPIAGYSPEKVKEVLGIPADCMQIALVIVGKKMDGISPVLSEKQLRDEKERPPRRTLEEIYAVDSYNDKLV